MRSEALQEQILTQIDNMGNNKPSLSKKINQDNSQSLPGLTTESNTLFF